jgi:pyrroline-5-carboxylate reductase
MRLGFIGLGSIASAVATGLAGDDHQIWVSERSKVNSTQLSQAFISVSVANNQSVIDQSEIVFLGTTAEAAPKALGQLRFREDQIVISFMADITTDAVKALIAPARFEAIVIPFPSIAEGGSPVLTYPKSEVVETVFGVNNTVISLPSEEALADYLAAQAVLSPILKVLGTSVDWLARKTGDYQSSEKFLRLLVGGSLMAKPMSAENVLPELIEALNTPGGLNRQFREFMEDEGVYDATERGLGALADRLS